MNLLGNAIKFTEQGEIVFRIELVSQEEQTATLRFAVTDTGIGLPRKSGVNFSAVRAGGRLDDSQVWRNRARFGHLRSAGGIDGRRNESQERTGPGQRSRSRSSCESARSDQSTHAAAEHSRAVQLRLRRCWSSMTTKRIGAYWPRCSRTGAWRRSWSNRPQGLASTPGVTR